MLTSTISLFVLGCALSQKPLPPTTQRDLLDGCHPQYALNADTNAQWQTEPPKTTNGEIVSRWVFHIDRKPAWAGLVLHADGDYTSVEINGHPARLPIKGMHYATLPGISPKLFRTGENTLKIVWSKKPRGPAVWPPSAKLVPFMAEGIAFQTEAVMGDAGTDYFTVGCRTNLRAEVTLEADGRKWTSDSGVVHSLRADGLKANTAYTYTLTAHATDAAPTKRLGPYTVHTLPEAAGGKLRFVAVGDSRTFPEDWSAVAAAIVKQKPDCVVFSGDMVTVGREDRLWDEQFFSVAKPYFAAIPSFYVMGNHEDSSPLVGRLISVPGRDRWAQHVGPTLMIGIDGARDWKTGSANWKWLDETLKASSDKYIFLFSHYPPWSSGPHGAAHEKECLQGREHIMPLLKKYNATAFIAGHEHLYERSEPADGVTVIVSGGAGAPLYPKSYILGLNPYSRVFNSIHHYCLLEIDGDRCQLRAFTPDGKQIDGTEWKARSIVSK